MNPAALYRFAIAPIALLALFGNGLFAQEIGSAAEAQINAILAAKRGLTGSQKKIHSNLMFAAMASRNDVAVSSFSAMIASPTSGPAGFVTVDIRANVNPTVLAAVTNAGGTVLNQSARWGQIHASLPLAALENLAASADVKSIRPAARRRLSGLAVRRSSPARATPSSIRSRTHFDLAGALTSQGFISQSANLVINNLGINGAGVTVGVLSDSASPARIAALIATGDLPIGTTVLPGQAGPSSSEGGTDEGAAMMEIVHDMAPGANLIFATADPDEITFANNIIALQAAGCKVIVDDVTYFDEGVFQDGPIAQAVNQVVAAGAIYFSAAGNDNNLTSGTSGVWEGDFLSGGNITGVIANAGETGLVHNFRTAASPLNYNVMTVATPFVQLAWSDPLGGSNNDYDLFVLNNAGTTLKTFSVSPQDGTEDPYELVYLNNGNTNFSVGDRIVVVQYSGLPRALHLHTFGGGLVLSTAGATFGHNAGLNTMSTAATYWNSAKTGTRAFTGAANPTEIFSSDGPRKIFFNPDGSAITPGNFLFGRNGGATLQKPDITATDGNSAKTPGFNPFFGTSAAAPHAAAVAALILQAKPTLTPAQIKAAMVNGTVDNMAAGVDRDSGYGIVMANLALQYVLSH